MAKRPCLGTEKERCGILTDQARCPRHRALEQQARDQRRGSSTARGYDRRHETTREAWRPEVEAGLVDCWRCGQRIQPGDEWDLGHDDNNRSIYRGPEHANQCNRASGGRRGAPSRRKTPPI